MRLDTGEEGYVEDINWRNTTVRQLSGNIVIVPNAHLADTVMTNYHQPVEETSVTVKVGVSYDSDLDEVERITLEVAREVGVSPSTVSNAYNRPDQLSGEVRERVMAAAGRLGYPGPNPLGRGLKRRRSDAVPRTARAAVRSTRRG